LLVTWEFLFFFPLDKGRSGALQNSAADPEFAAGQDRQSSHPPLTLQV